MISKPFLMCFTGIDGTGKTSLSKEIAKEMNERGFKCRYVYARLNPILLRPFIKLGDLLFLRQKNIFKNYHDYSKTKEKAITNHATLSSIYLYILLADYFLQLFFKVKIPLLLGENVVCDRYVYDTIITDLSPFFNYSNTDLRNLLANIGSIFPKPDKIFLIDIDEGIAFRRKSDVPSIDYLIERRKLYLEFSQYCKMTVLDGTKDITYLKDLVLSLINGGSK